MSITIASVNSQTVDAMREAFDHGFSLPIDALNHAWADFLLIRLGQLPHALHMDEVAGLQRATENGVTPLPSPLQALLGIAGYKGHVMPVYDLAALLGLPSAVQAKWHIVTRTPSVILAVDDFERHVRSSAEAVARQSASEQAQHGHIRAHLITEADQRPIVSLASVLDAIEKMSQTARQER